MRMILICIAVANFAVAAVSADMVTQSFAVEPSLEEAVAIQRDRLANEGIVDLSKPMPEVQEEDWKVFFHRMGVTWPDGSSVKYDMSHGQLSVTTTSSNMALIDKLIAPCYVPHQVRIGITLLSAPTERMLHLFDGTNQLPVADATMIRSRTTAVAASGCELQAVIPSPSGGTARVLLLPEIAPEGTMVRVSFTSEFFATHFNIADGATLPIASGLPTAVSNRQACVIVDAAIIGLTGQRLVKDNPGPPAGGDGKPAPHL